jgi:hypothetical protein
LFDLRKVLKGLKTRRTIIVLLSLQKTKRPVPFVIASKRSNQITRGVPKFQILNMFIILNTDITSLRAG